MKRAEQQLRQEVLRMGVEQGATQRFADIAVTVLRLENWMLPQLSEWPEVPSVKNGYGNFPWPEILAKTKKSSTYYPFVLMHEGRIEVAAVLKISKTFGRVSLRYVERRTDGHTGFKRLAAVAAIDACVAVAAVTKALFANQNMIVPVQIAVHDPAPGLVDFYKELSVGLDGKPYWVKQEQTLILGFM